MKSIKYLSLAICFGALVSSCTKKLDEAYPNPNAPLGLKPSDLLQPITYQMAVNLQDDYRYIGLYAQVFSYRLTYAAGSTDAFAYFDKMGYRAGVDNSGAIWRMHYFNIGQNLNSMRSIAVENNQWDYVGAADAIQAWSWLTTTDYHGEIILKEAFNTGLLSFHYDKQEDVYARVRELCRSAIANFDKPVTGGDFATGDQWFNGGDINKWKKFTYGVMARSFLHLTNKANFQADSVIYYCDKAMQTPAEDATIKFQGNIAVNNTNNFYGPFRGNLGSFRQSKYICELMKGSYAPFTGVDDPRKWYMLMTAPDFTTFNGYDPTKGEGPVATAARPRNFWGLVGTVSPGSGLDTARFLFRNNAEYPIMTSSEIQFMKAEAAFRKNDKGTARTAYLQGISQHMDMLTAKYESNIYAGRNLTPAVKAAFLANPTVAPSAAGLTLSHIMQQKFIALWGYGVLETWTDLRRYHYNKDLDALSGLPVYNGWTPVAPADLWTDNGGLLAYRVRPRYNSEYVWNLSELAKFGGDQLNYHTKEMWFSQP